jgi:lipopolysaccharide export system protein LptA
MVVYIGLYIYGQNLANPFVNKKKEANAIIFKNNSVPVFRNDGKKLAHFYSKELITNYKNYQANQVNFHIYGAIKEVKSKDQDNDSMKKINSPSEDVIIDADTAEFINLQNPVYFKKNVKMTYGNNTYLETEECQWTKETDTIYFPQTLTVQSGTNLIKGEKATYNTYEKNVTIEKNIISFFELVDHKFNKASKNNAKLTKLTSEGPLVYNSSHQSIKLPHFSTIKNLDFTLIADQIELYLNNENKVQLLIAEGNVKIVLLEKNVVAWSPKASIDFTDKNYHFIEKNNVSPYIEMNGYRQTASYITYNETTELLKAGPEVRSVKIISNSKE